MTHFISPFSTPLKFEAVSARIIGKPKAAPEHPGWGIPYFDDQGNRIFPGTEGGADTSTSIGEKEGVWKEKKSPKLQSVGNISWRGKKKASTGDARVIVTFSGPPSRCFHTGTFTYGADSEEKYIYKDGGVLAIAPGSVTGAAITNIVPKDIGGRGEVAVPHVVAVVYVSGSEKLMARAVGSTFIKSKITAEQEALLTGYRDTENPDGWAQLGLVGYGGYGPPTVPWLFNEDGNEAQTIRMKTKQVLDQFGATKEELAGERVKLVLQGGAVTYSVMGNNPPFYLMETATLSDGGVYSALDPNDVNHTWNQLTMVMTTEGSGRQVVAVDYIENTEVVIELVLNSSYENQYDYMKGTDVYDSQDPYCTYGMYGNRDRLGVPDAQHPGDGSGSKWIGGKTETYLSYTVAGVETRILLEFSGLYTSDTMDGRPYDPTNSNLFYREVFVQRLRFLDVRAGGFIAVRSHLLKSFSQTSWGTTEEFEGYDMDFSDSATTAYLSSNSDWGYVDESDAFPTVQSSGSWALMQGLGSGYTWQWSCESYLGVRPKGNDSNTIGYIGFKGWFPPGQTLTWEGWYAMDLLRHSQHTKDSGFVHLGSGKFIVSGDFIDPEDGVLKSISQSAPFNVESLSGGKSFHPLGEV